MEKTMTLPKIADEAAGVAKLDGILRELSRRLKRMRKLDAEIGRLRSRTRAALDRMRTE
jgi:chromosome segregation ATPase